MRLLRLFVVIIGFGPCVLAQQLMHIDRSKMCSWNEDAIIPEDLYNFPPDASTKAAVADIMRYTGLEINFDLVAANVPNAVATMQNGKRLILYNQIFMKDIAKTTGTDWAAKAILAHEIGHHLMQHTLGVGGGIKSEQELAADRFSGDVLFKMGATLDFARAAMESRPETKSPYYPKKSVRLIAIGNGWIAAQELAGQTSPAPAKTDTGVSQRASEAQAEADRRAERAQTLKDREAEKQAAIDAKEEREAKAAERAAKAEERAAKREQAESRRGCYAYGRRYCTLPEDLPLGTACYCNGVAGIGIVGNP